MKKYKFDPNKIKKDELNGFFDSFPEDAEYTDAELELDVDNIWCAVNEGEAGYPEFKSRAEVKEYMLERLECVE